MTKVNFPRVFMGENGDSGYYITQITQKAPGVRGCPLETAMKTGEDLND